MLCLHVREDGIIVIDHRGEQLVVKVYRNRHGKLKLVFDGPESFAIMRQETLKSDGVIEKSKLGQSKE